MYQEQAEKKYKIKESYHEKLHKLNIERIKKTIEYESEKMQYELDYKQQKYERVYQARNNCIFALVTTIAVCYLGIKLYRIRLKYLQNKRKNEAMDAAYNVLWLTLCLWYFFWSLFAVINNVFMTFSFMDTLFSDFFG